MDRAAPPRTDDVDAREPGTRRPWRTQRTKVAVKQGWYIRPYGRTNVERSPSNGKVGAFDANDPISGNFLRGAPVLSIFAISANRAVCAFLSGEFLKIVTAACRALQLFTTN